MPQNTIDAKDLIIGYVKNFVTNTEDAIVYITDEVSFNMRKMIRKYRKNYYGVFEEPIDPTTKIEKIWPHLTQSLVEAVVKNIDLDTKDINIVALKKSAIPLSSIIRQIVRDFLKDIGFGEKLDQLERVLAINGTAIWKTYKEYNNYKGKTELCTKPVDLLNFYIDPTAESIKDSVFSGGLVVERAILSQEQIQKMESWKDTKDVSYQDNLHPTDRNLTQDVGRLKGIEVYEVWGYIPVSETEKKFMHVVISNLLAGAKIHLAEEVDYCPYEEAWYRRATGRWYGIGIPEMVMGLQEWLNTVVNIRINRSRFAQLGLFKMRRGSGITPDMLTEYVSGGVIPVNNMDDIEQFVMQEASQASYNDEQVIQSWAERVTQAFDVVTGERMPSSTPATNALIQSQSAQSSFTLIKEQLGMFLQRWMRNHVFDYIADSISMKKAYRIIGSPEELRAIDEKIVNGLLYEKLLERRENGEFFNPEEVEGLKADLTEKLKLDENQRFFNLVGRPELFDYDVDVQITNEEIDKGVLVQNLLTTLQLAPEYRDVVISQVFDLMGLDVNQLESVKGTAIQGQQMAQMPIQQTGQSMSPMKQLLAANSPV